MDNKMFQHLLELFEVWLHCRTYGRTVEEVEEIVGEWGKAILQSTLEIYVILKTLNYPIQEGVKEDCEKLLIEYLSSGGVLPSIPTKLGTHHFLNK